MLVTAPPGDTRRIFVVEQGGTIRIVREGTLVPSPFLDIRERVTARGESGLLSIAFAPDYASTGLLYAFYNAREGPYGDIRIAEFRVDGVRPGHGRPVLRADSAHDSEAVREPQRRHAPVRLRRLPVRVGRRRRPRRARTELERSRNASTCSSATSSASTRAAAIRTRCPPTTLSLPSPARDPRSGRTGSGIRGASGSIPRRTSSTCRTSGARHARRSTSSLAVDAVPTSAGRASRGRWSSTTRRRANAAVAPLLDYPRANGVCAVIGGVVVRDPRLAALSGRYLYGDLCIGCHHGDRSRRRPDYRFGRAGTRRPRALELRRRRTRARLRHVPPRRRLPARSAARALNSATHAAPRSPSQIGVKST